MHNVVYTLTNTLTGRLYVGSAEVFSVRQRAHLHHLNARTHHCVYLENAWHKYGAGAFVWDIIATAEHVALLLPMEQAYLDHYGRLGILYNHCKVAGSTSGVKATEETKAKISAAKKGTKVSDDARAKISATMMGKGKSDDTKAKMSAYRAGRKYTEEELVKLRATREASAPQREAERRAYWEAQLAAGVKICTVCERSQPLSEFNRRVKSPDGLSPLCRTCKKNTRKKAKENGNE